LDVIIGKIYVHIWYVINWSGIKILNFMSFLWKCDVGISQVHYKFFAGLLFLLSLMWCWNILSFWYWNQAIQKPKFIYASRTTTLMKESNRFKEQNPSRGENPCFHTRYSNRNILSFWYQNQAIQKPKFMYAFRTTTLMKELNWDKIFLKNRIWQ